MLDLDDVVRGTSFLLVWLSEVVTLRRTARGVGTYGGIFNDDDTYGGIVSGIGLGEVVRWLF